MQADSDGKEAKWADIDDDEDDWAPEAIEWNDGTKITLAQNDTAPAYPEQKPIEPSRKEDSEDDKDSIPSAPPKPTTTVGPNATVLKPRLGLQPKTGGVVLKSPSEKHALVSKPAAPVPVRSPWATLPPVDKVPPIAINPDMQGGLSKILQTESPAPQPMAPPPPPAMEIAADSFTRSRGDGANGSVGQLYNAQSGRYEPANTGRRGSVRKDQSFRPPSVLQRGSVDQRGPNESPSSLQARQEIQSETGTWVRRASSNVSGDSGAPGRKGSISRVLPNGSLSDRRGSENSQVLQSPSTSHVSVDGAKADFPVFSPAIQHAQLAETRPDAAPLMQVQNDQEAREAQRHFMKEKAEAAMKRKEEAEAKERAEREERIRARLEKLDATALQKHDMAKNAPDKAADTQPIEQPKIEEKRSELPNQIQQEQKPSSPTEARKAGSITSPPKPPVLDASGAPQQYGMIKMHGPAPIVAHHSDFARFGGDKSKMQAQSQGINASDTAPVPTLTDRVPSPLVNGVKHAEASPPKASELPHQKLVRESRPQQWSDIPKDQKMLAAWGSHQNPRDSSSGQSNVWGAPSQSRALGNGTFDRAPPKSQPRPQDQFASPNLAPIGPPKSHQSQREIRDSLRPTESVLSSSIEDLRSAPPLSGDGAASSRVLEPIGRPTSTDDRSLPPHYSHGLQPRSQYANPENKALDNEPPKLGLQAWGNFHVSSQEENVKQQQQAVVRPEEGPTSLRYEPQLPIMNETWRQVKVDDQTTQRSVVSVTRGQNIQGQPSSSQINLDTRDNAFASHPSINSSAPAGIGRGSRFFPTTARHTPHPYAKPMPFTPGYRRGSSPPPPDSDFHPAFARDQPRPRVSLPTVPPKPKVRLPPSVANVAQSSKASEPQQLPVRTLQASAPPPTSWQDRINTLFGHKKASAGNNFADPVALTVTSGFSATKSPLTSPVIQASAAVSLPHVESSDAKSQTVVVSKDVADEDALFIPESGSLPIALLPPAASRKASPPTSAWSSGPPKSGVPKPTRPSKEVEAASKDTLLDVATMSNGGPLIFIRLQGMKLPKSKPMFTLTGRIKVDNISSPPQQRPRNFSGGAKSSKPGFKHRQGPGPFGGPSKGTHTANQRHNQNSPHSQAPMQSNIKPSSWPSTFVH